MGSWSGLTRAEIEAGWPEALQGATEHEWYFRSPDGETLEALCVRLSAWLREQRGPTIAVSHGLAGKVLRGVYAGLTESDMLRQPELQDRAYVLRDGTIRLLRSGPRHAPHGLSGWKP